MKRFFGGVATLGLALSLVASPAQAQLSGNPVYAWTGGPGVTFAGEFGRGVNDESAKTNHFGGRIGVSLPVVGVWAGGAIFDPRGGLDKEVTFGGGVAVNVFSPPLMPISVSLQAGAGYLSQEIDVLGVPTSFNTLNVPISAVVAFDVASPTLDIEPWIAPRISILRTSIGGAGSTDVGFGASAGLNVTLPAGFGGHFGLDWMTIGDPSVKPLLFGAGLHYRIPLPSPSLGM